MKLPLININYLKKITKKAYIEKELKRKEEEKNRKEWLKTQMSVEEKRANEIIKTIPGLCKRAAEQGKSEIKICNYYRTTFYSWEQDLCKGNPIEDKMNGFYKIIWNYCEKQGLKPSVHVESNNPTGDCTYYIQANW